MSDTRQATRKHHALTVAAIRAAKPRSKAYRLTDGAGLSLTVAPNGGKWWRYRYRIDGKEKMLSLGTFPDVSLAQARERLRSMREQVADGIDPSAVRKAAEQPDGDSFQAVAEEWWRRQASKWSEGHATKTRRRLEIHLYPLIGDTRVDQVSASQLLAALRRIEEAGTLSTTHRARAIAGQVFRYAIATGRAERDPSADLRGALTPNKETHHPSVTDPAEIGPLLRAIDGYGGQFPVVCALRLAPLLFVRPGELRHAEWSEIDTKDALWRIPGSKMKAGRTHLVPLSTQALTIIQELRSLTGKRRYLFPSIRTPDRPISDNTLNAALRRMGYAQDQMTAHGFRSMASTRLHEMGWPSEAIERQLAHQEGNQVKAAYNYAEHLETRREMMQSWADYLERLAGTTDE